LVRHPRLGERMNERGAAFQSVASRHQFGTITADREPRLPARELPLSGSNRMNHLDSQIMAAKALLRITEREERRRQAVVESDETSQKEKVRAAKDLNLFAKRKALILPALHLQGGRR
jgi:hypothetical protein